MSVLFVNFVHSGCVFKGKCYKFAETVVHNCFVLECSTSDGTHIKWEPIKKGKDNTNKFLTLFQELYTLNFYLLTWVSLEQI